MPNRRYFSKDTYFFLLLVFSFGLIPPRQVQAQISVGIACKTLSANGWYDFLRREQSLDFDRGQGYAMSVGYWFRLKKHRIEFLPEISYEHFGDKQENSEIRHRAGAFYYNINLYPFDFNNDCDCPVWSKQGSFFSKGFFLQLSPGLMYLKNTLAFEPANIKNEKFVWAVGIGGGLDLGISDLITVTPLIRFYYAPGVGWSDLPDVRRTPNHVSTAVRQLYAGIALGLRTAHVGKRRK